VVLSLANKYHCGGFVGESKSTDQYQTVVVVVLLNLRINSRLWWWLCGIEKLVLLKYYSGSVFSCGMNTYGQLGQVPPTEKCLTPKVVRYFCQFMTFSYCITTASRSYL
jgi:Regulator of chromosome condensation (RCC1) repeat